MLTTKSSEISMSFWDEWQYHKARHCKRGRTARIVNTEITDLVRPTLSPTERDFEAAQEQELEAKEDEIFGECPPGTEL